MAGGGSLLRDGGIKGASTLVTGLLALAASIVLARVLPQEDLGLFVLVLAMVQIGVMLADGGSGLAMTRYLAAAGSRERRRDIVRGGIRARLMITAVAISLGLVLMPWLRRVLFDGSLTRSAFLWVMAWILGKSLFLLVPSILRGRMQWFREGALLVAEAAGIIAVYMTCRSAPIASGQLPMRLAILYAILAGVGILALTARSRITATGSDDGTAVTMTRLLAFGLPLVMNTSLFLALSWTDRILLGLFRSREELAFYYVAVGLTTAGRMVFAVPEQVLYSRLAATCRPGDPGLPRTHADVFDLFAWLGLLMVVVASMAGRVAVPVLYGAEYAASVWPFQLLLAVLLVRIVSIPASLFLIVVFERTPETRNSLAIAFVANLLLNIVLIPRYGVSGAILASLAGFLLATWYLWRAMGRQAGLSAAPPILFRLLLAAAVWLGCTAAEHYGLLPGWGYWTSQAILTAAVAVIAWRRVSPWLDPALQEGT